MRWCTGGVHVYTPRAGGSTKNNTSRLSDLPMTYKLYATGSGLRSGDMPMACHLWTVLCHAPLFWSSDQKSMARCHEQYIATGIVLQCAATVHRLKRGLGICYRAIYSTLLQYSILVVHFQSNGPDRKAQNCSSVTCPWHVTGSQSTGSSVPMAWY
jgi:hypothetical protein